jgi:hypothetical protein
MQLQAQLTEYHSPIDLLQLLTLIYFIFVKTALLNLLKPSGNFTYDQV